MTQDLETVLKELHTKYPKATFIIDDHPDDDRTMYEGDYAGVMTMQYLLNNAVHRVDEAGAPDRITIYIEEEYI